MALALESTLNIPAEFWIRLQKNHELQRDLIELKNQTTKSGAVTNKKINIPEWQKNIAMEHPEKYRDTSSSASGSGSEFDEK